MPPPLAKVTYIFDAYCGWCFGFAPALHDFYEKNSQRIDLTIISGGLFTGQRVAPMSAAPYIKSANASIAAKTGAKFGKKYEDLVTDGTFVMDSTDAAAGFSSLRQQDPQKSLAIAAAMQNAFYGEGKSLSAISTYEGIADTLSLDKSKIFSTLRSPEARQAATQDFSAARKLGVNSYPTLVFHAPDGTLIQLGSPLSSGAEITRDLNSCFRAHSLI